MIVLVNKKKFAKNIAVLLIIILFVTALLNINNIKKLFYPVDYSFYVEKYSKEYNLDKYLVYSLIKTESDFDENAVSKKGAKGLMQLMPETASEYAKKLEIQNFKENMLFEPETNIRIGCYYISFPLDRYDGDAITAVAAYNAGYGRVDNCLATEQTDKISLDIIPFGETKKHIQSFEKNYNNYKKIYAEER